MKRNINFYSLLGVLTYSFFKTAYVIVNWMRRVLLSLDITSLEGFCLAPPYFHGKIVSSRADTNPVIKQWQHQEDSTSHPQTLPAPAVDLIFKKMGEM